MKNFDLNNLTTEELLLLQSEVAIQLAKRNDNDKYKTSCDIQFSLIENLINQFAEELQDYHNLCFVAENNIIEVTYNGDSLYYIRKGNYFLNDLNDLLDIKKMIKEVINKIFFTNKLKDKVRKTGMDVEIHDIPIKVIQLSDKRVIKLIGEEFTLLENRIETPITEELAQQILDRLEVM